MSTFVKKSKVPDTVVGEDGTAKRNIIRRGGCGKSRKDGLPGQPVDDGSSHDDSCALDEHDPNYDSEEDTGNRSIPKYAALHRDDVALSHITLTTYKKQVEPIIAEFFVSGDIDDTASSIQVYRFM